MAHPVANGPDDLKHSLCLCSTNWTEFEPGSSMSVSRVACVLISGLFTGTQVRKLLWLLLSLLPLPHAVERHLLKLKLRLICISSD
jgi:hypothetical protein